jgi:hypothetical protein
LSKSSVLFCFLLWAKGLNEKDIHKERTKSNNPAVPTASSVPLVILSKGHSPTIVKTKLQYSEEVCFYSCVHVRHTLIVSGRS